MLPIPEVTDANLAFPTGVSTPPWEDVPREFQRGHPTPWHRLAEILFAGKPPATEWNGIPQEGVDAALAWRAVCDTMGNRGIKHERKIATLAWMLSEWFLDFWWDGDTHTTINNIDLGEDAPDHPDSPAGVAND